MSPTSSKLLVVDGEPGNLDALSRRLAGRGYSVDVARDGVEALRKISQRDPGQTQYDLVLLDQALRGAGGLDMLRILRSTHAPSDLPVILFTAEAAEALRQGANDYVVKPSRVPEVATRIDLQLSKTEQERREKLTDPLTGLGNRTFLLKRLEAAIAGCSMSSGPLVVLLLDLDDFKVLNDTFGYKFGDHLLREVGARLLQAARTIAAPARIAVARLAGDEFAILFEDVTHAGKTAEYAQAVLAAIRAPVNAGTHELIPSASAGSTVWENGQTTTPEGLISEADLALHRARELGKNRHQAFHFTLRERAQRHITLALDLEHALERGQLETYYQPEIDLTTGAIVGFEALLRWRHPSRGLVPPSEFIPLAEENDLIHTIGIWVLRQACGQLKDWQERFPSVPPLTMNVNLSVKQLADPRLVRQVEEVLKETGIHPETLKLELTESSLMTRIESARQVLSCLRSLQVGLKLDDFGTGYSSLSHLRHLDFESLKIDQSFIKRVAADPETSAIVSAIMSLAKTLKMDVVAEGIESEEQRWELLRLGCETGQGFLFSAPVTASSAEGLLRLSAA